jgi:uncharacterized protein (TIGR00299 family) protein
MKIIYFDCFSGASGDMILAALLDAGAPLDFVKAQLAKLPLSGFGVNVTRVEKKGLWALDVDVVVTEKEQSHRHFRDIEAMLTDCGLTPAVRDMSLAIFGRLAAAEGKIHNKPSADVHFHEVGAVDSIVDIVGAAAAYHALGIEKAYCSPLHTGTGFVRCAHGELPVPAPATLELLTGVPVYSRGIEAELLTPTGAAILTTIAEFGPLPAMTVQKTGYGAGKKDLPMANLLRVTVGEAKVTAGLLREEAFLLEANIDDMNPEIYSHVTEKLFAAGALDVTLMPVQMKKNRPGILLSVLVKPEKEDAATTILFRETTTLGVRRTRVEKMMLTRRHITVQTPYGEARVKIGEAGGRSINAAPEYEDCLALAQKSGAPLKDIYTAVLTAYTQSRG